MDQDQNRAPQAPPLQQKLQNLTEYHFNNRAGRHPDFHYKPVFEPDEDGIYLIVGKIINYHNDPDYDDIHDKDMATILLRKGDKALFLLPLLRRYEEDDGENEYGTITLPVRVDGNDIHTLCSNLKRESAGHLRFNHQTECSKITPIYPEPKPGK